MLPSYSINRFFFFNSYLYYRSSYKLRRRRMIYCFLENEGYLVHSLDRVISPATIDKFASQLFFKNQVQELNRIFNIALTATEKQLI
jgi:hypothetical protein